MITIVRTTTHQVKIDKDEHEQHSFTFAVTNGIWKASVEYIAFNKHWSKVEFGPDLEHSPIWFTSAAWASHFQICNDNWLDVHNFPTVDCETSVYYELTEFVNLLGQIEVDIDLAITVANDIDRQMGSSD